jgi:hypothetical protein
MKNWARKLVDPKGEILLPSKEEPVVTVCSKEETKSFVDAVKALKINDMNITVHEGKEKPSDPKEIASKGVVFSVTDYDGITYSFKVGLLTEGIEDADNAIKNSMDYAVEALSERIVKKLKEHAINKPGNIDWAASSGSFSTVTPMMVSGMGFPGMLTTGTIIPNTITASTINAGSITTQHLPVPQPVRILDDDDNPDEMEELAKMEQAYQQNDTVKLSYNAVYLGNLYGSSIYMTT